MISATGRGSTTGLTARQREVYDFIRTFIDHQGFPPTHQEIAAGMGFRSANSAAQHVRLMAKKGVLSVAAGAARGISLQGPEEGLPVIGEVAAGEPIVAEARIERRLELASELFRPKADYLLRIRGTSMKKAGILPGDLVAVHASPRASAGDIAVVRLGDDVTVKRWRPQSDRIVLEAESDSDPSIEVDPKTQDITVEGVVVGLLRLPA